MSVYILNHTQLTYTFVYIFVKKMHISKLIPLRQNNIVIAYDQDLTITGVYVD